MTNFIFKSQGTYKKLCQQLEIIQSELRHQRSEHAIILSLLTRLQNDSKLQSQVNDYYEEDVSEPPKEQVQDLD